MKSECFKDLFIKKIESSDYYNTYSVGIRSSWSGLIYIHKSSTRVIEAIVNQLSNSQV